MELDDLKNEWNKIADRPKSEKELMAMISENNHPVLRKMRLQLGAELLGWILFLLVYYTMFDGDQKPAWLNFVLIVSVLMPVIHNILGYRAARFIVRDNTVRTSLVSYLSTLKTYSRISVFTRIVFALGLLNFFVSGIEFTNAKYFFLSAIILVFAVQIWLLWQAWKKRLERISLIVKDLSITDQ